MERRSYLTSIGVLVGTACSAGCMEILGGSAAPLTVTNTSAISRAGVLVVEVTVENTTESPQKGELVTEISFTENNRTESKKRPVTIAAGDSRTVSFSFIFTSSFAGDSYSIDTSIEETDEVPTVQQGPTISGTVESTPKQAPWPAPYYSNQNTNHNPNTSGPRERPEVVREVDTGFTNRVVIGKDLLVNGGGVFQRETGEELWFGIDPSWPPVIDDKTIYYSTSEEILAFDAVNKEVLWEGKNWDCTPAVADGTVFVGNLGPRDTENVIAALDAESGEPLWEVDSPGRVRTPPAITDERIIFSSEEGAIGVDRTSGERLWTGRAPGSYAGIAAVAYGIAFVTPPGNDQLVARDPRSGRLYWSKSIPGLGGGQPAIGHETIVVPREDILIAYNAKDGSFKWKNQVEGEYGGLPSIAGETVYHGTSSGALRAFDIDSGDQLFSIQMSGEVEENLPVVDGKIYVNPFGEPLKILE